MQTFVIGVDPVGQVPTQLPEDKLLGAVQEVQFELKPPLHSKHELLHGLQDPELLYYPDGQEPDMH